MSRGRFSAAAVVGLAWLLASVRPALAAPQPATPGEEIVVLDTHGFWRMQMGWRPGPVRMASGELKPLVYSWSKLTTDPIDRVVPGPPANWIQPDFDDTEWVRVPGPIVGGRADRSFALLCLRGRFEVSEPAKVSALTLSLGYRGGAVVYVNGQELARGHLPPGPTSVQTLADDYPPDAYLDPDGFLLRHGWGDPAKYADRFASRVRRLGAVKVPGSMLRKGVNVLGVELHAAPVAEMLFVHKVRAYERHYCWWSQLGFEELKLAVPAESGVRSSARRPAGLIVRAADPAVTAYDQDYPDASEPVGPIRLAGCRNGTFFGLALASSSGPIAGLSVRAGNLTGEAGTIPAGAVSVAYGLPDGTPEWGSEQRYDRRPLRFDGLADKPPADLPVPPQADGVTLPIRVAVRVPATARPGRYGGRLTVAARGAAPIELPIELTIADFALPDPQQFVCHVGLVQSPDTLAIRYNVPMWSRKHWALIDKAFELLGRVGNKTLFIPIIRHAHFGNEHSMVRWVRQPGGGFKHDFSIVEKYVDIAVKHLGNRIPVVCIYAWDPCLGSAYLDPNIRRPFKPLPFTVLDPATGKLTEAESPTFGAPEMRTFYQPVFDGLRELLSKRGLADSMMVGMAGDSRPTAEVVADLQAVAPQAKWVVHSHATADKLHGQPVGYLADVWGAPVAPPPSVKRLYGWQNPFLRTTFPRAGSNTVAAIRLAGPAVQYRLALEGCQAAGLHGLGRIGADFWTVIKDTRGRSGNLLGRYPESGWAQLNLENSFAYVLSPGPDGPLPTVRFEMLLAGEQEAEARIFLEKALTDATQREKLGDDLADRCRKLLDDRTWAILVARTASDASWLWYAGGVRRWSQYLFAAAAQVAKVLND